MIEKLKQNLANYDKALISLESNITKIKNMPQDAEDFDIYRDSTIQRFEYSIELSKKLMGNYIEFIDKRVHGQKLILKKAYEFDLIEDEIWFEMIDDRNITSHEYSENLAKELLFKIYDYSIKLREFFNIIKKQIDAV
ncbi:MAG: HI0074 family nucleotidyltransferase substrate-binding subunit [Campylobacterota bacterium]|nr:HI0074 family nucleotidyltransferase substrate-binding subunit [Campylobacterota bacterium]